MDKERIFSQDEATNLYRCIIFAQENCSTLTYGYPDLEDHPPAFEPEEGIQLNM